MSRSTVVVTKARASGQTTHMQLPAEAVTTTALIEVVRISALPTGRDDPYPGCPLGRARICAELTIGEEKKWRSLQRYLGRRESYAETHAAIAGLVSDRAARRPARRRTSTELVLARQTAC